MRQELDRFLVLFDRLAHATNDWIEATPEDRLDWVPVDNPNVRFGDRVSRVTIKSLYVHVAVGEHHWTRNLRDVADGAAIPLPKDAALTAGLVSRPDWVDETMRMHDANMAIMRAYGAGTLGKRIRFVERSYTAMGFLWAVYAHRAYHLGNIDIYLRQADRKAPDFFHFQPMMMA